MLSVSNKWTRSEIVHRKALNIEFATFHFQKSKRYLCKHREQPKIAPRKKKKEIDRVRMTIEFTNPSTFLAPAFGGASIPSTERTWPHDPTLQLDMHLCWARGLAKITNAWLWNYNPLKDSLCGTVGKFCTAPSWSPFLFATTKSSCEGMLWNNDKFRRRWFDVPVN